MQGGGKGEIEEEEEEKWSFYFWEIVFIKKPILYKKPEKKCFTFHIRKNKTVFVVTYVLLIIKTILNYSL